MKYTTLGSIQSLDKDVVPTMPLFYSNGSLMLPHSR